MVTIDLHTHSIISYDGGIREDEYGRTLSLGKLDCIAITDHNEIAFAQKLSKRLGERIIVGEEIKTSQGEMIGLFLKERVAAGLTARETAKEIRRQGGIVYIPHPFETKRSSMQQATLESVDRDIDIVEVFNARGFLLGKPDEAIAFAKEKNLAMAASSDAHGLGGLGSAFSTIALPPKKETLVALLQKGTLQRGYGPFYTLLYPIFNKMKKTLSI